MYETIGMESSMMYMNEKLKNHQQPQSIIHTPLLKWMSPTPLEKQNGGDSRRHSVEYFIRLFALNLLLASR